MLCLCFPVYFKVIIAHTTIHTYIEIKEAEVDFFLRDMTGWVRSKEIEADDILIQSRLGQVNYLL